MSEGDSAMSDAEKMRLKRLARLGGPSSASPSPVPQPPDQQQHQVQQKDESSPRPPAAAASRLLSTPTSGPSTSTSRSETTPQPSRTATPSAKRPARRLSPVRPQEPIGPRIVGSTSQSTKPAISYADWEVNKIAAVFSVALDRQAAERSDWRLCWLKSLAQEIKEEEPAHPLRTSIDLVDRLLVARLSLEPSAMAASDDPDVMTILAGLPTDETVFEYLTGCWKRLYAANREISRIAFSPAEKTEWQSSFTKMKSLIISYCGMTLEDPTMFPQPDRPTGPAEFLPILLSLAPATSNSTDPLTSTGITLQAAARPPLSAEDLPLFLADLAAGFETSQLADVISPTLSLFFQEWFKITPTPDLLGIHWRQWLAAMSILVQNKTIAALLPNLPIWIAPGVTAAKIEWQSLLGPLTRLSVYPREFPEIWKAYFSDPTDRKVADIDANKSNLRHTLGALHDSLFKIYNAIVRSSPQSREKILDFFATIIHLNEKRAGMRVDPRTVSSDGFMTNTHAILLKLFEPVMDVSYSKIDKVDPNYFRLSKRLDITEETKIKATKEEADEYYGNGGMDIDTPPHFISDLFFLLNASQHLGINKTIGNRVKAEKNITDFEKDLRRAEAARGEWAGNPAMEAQGEAAIQKLKNDIATLHASIHAYDTQLLDPAFTRLNVTFTCFLMTWLVRLVDPKHQHPAVPIVLPLPSEAPLQFRMLPEYLFENVAEYLDFLAHHDLDALMDPDKDTLITFVLTFLAPGYVNNPFLKAKLVSVLAGGLYPAGYYRRGTLFDRLSLHPLSTTYLMPTLIRFFIDVEMTGGHTQFWDKFSFRRDISRVFKSMWENPLHREAFVKSRRDDFDQFIKFINMLMSDTTFHLEESLSSLSKIHSFQALKDDKAGWDAMPQNEQEDITSQLRQEESSAPFHTQMGLDHIKLIRDFTATTVEPFVTAEIVDRLAATLNENLVNLVGPKMQELRVANPEKLAFKPKDLLASIAQIYLNLGQEPDFIRAVANDGRSYSKSLFEKFARILKNRAIMTDPEVAQVISFTQKVEDMKATIMIEDEREIPDEFLDPLLSTLMRDPVILPVSRVTVDRSTIRTVLLSKELDPFNNVPLKLEDCIPDTELKAKIDAWAAEGNAKPAEGVMEVDQL